MTALAPRPRSTAATADVLVDAALDGDEFAWQLLCDRYVGEVRTVAHARLRDAHAAEDVVQETLVRAWTRLHQLDDPQRLGAWLKTIAARVAVDHLRARREHAPLDQVADRFEGGVEPLVDHVLEREQAETLHAHLADLRERERVALWNRDALGVTVAELADHLGMTTGSVRVLLTRARTRVRDAYGLLAAPVLGLLIRLRNRFAGLGESSAAAFVAPAVVLAAVAGVTVSISAPSEQAPLPVADVAPAPAVTEQAAAEIRPVDDLWTASVRPAAMASETPAQVLSSAATPAPEEDRRPDLGVVGPDTGFHDGPPADREPDREVDSPVGPIAGTDLYLQDTVGDLSSGDGCLACG